MCGATASEIDIRLLLVVGRSNASRIHAPFRCDPIHTRTREQVWQRGTSVVEHKALGRDDHHGIEFTAKRNCWPMILFPGQGTKSWPGRNAAAKASKARRRR